jgi:hypothetical protein
MEVISYLQTHSLDELLAEHHIEYSLSACKTKASLNYSMLETPRGLQLGWDCRGLVIARADFQPINPAEKMVPIVLARPFRRFFNLGEGFVQTDFQDSKLRVLDKLDGTLIILYWDPIAQDWAIATRSSPNASGNVNQESFSFDTLARKAFSEAGIKFSYLTKGLTYCFELTSPYNQIVVPYEKLGITFLTAVDNETGKEYRNHWGFPEVQSFPIGDQQGIRDFVESRPARQGEGVVVVDSNNHRCKIKSQSYIYYHGVKGGKMITRRQVIQFLAQGIDDDIEAYGNAYEKKLIQDIRAKYVAFCQTMDKKMQNLLKLDREQLVRWQMLNPSPLTGAIYNMYDRKLSASQYLVQTVFDKKTNSYLNSRIDSVLKMIGAN